MQVRVIQRLGESGVEQGHFADSSVANDWGTASINITQVGNFTEAPYGYALTALKEVEKVVRAGAGLGKIGKQVRA